MERDANRSAASLALAALLGAGAFWNGLYSPAQQLIPTAALAAAALWLRGAAELSRLEAAALLCLGAGVAASLAAPAAAGTAAHGPAIAAGWVLALLVGRRIAVGGGEAAVRLLGRIWAFTGPLMVFGGLVGMSYLPAHHSGRLAAFLGYPIAVGILGMLGLAGSLPPLAAGRWWAPALAYGNGMALFLSGSRGVWAVAALLAAYLAWAAPGLLRRAWWPVAAALAGAVWAGPAVAARTSAPALIAFVAGSLTAPAVAWFHGRFARPWPGLAAALAALGMAAGLAPGWNWFLGRATALSLSEGSSVERLTFLRDGLAMARGLPLGAGYHAWTALHLQRASYSYYSAEVHSAPLDLAIGFGWLGAAGFLLLLARFLWGLREGRAWEPERAAVLAGLGALAIHGLVDWDLSYAVFMIPLWLGFGLLAPARLRVKVPFALTTGVAALSLAAVVILGAGDIFAGEAVRALAGGRPETAYLHASMAAAVAPWDDEAHATAGEALGALGKREAALAEIGRARRLGLYEPWYAELEARELLKAGRLREAAAAYREVVRLWPWHVPAYEEALEAHMDLVLRAQILGDQALTTDLMRSGQAVLGALDRQKAKEPPGMPRKPMQTDTPTLQRAHSFFPGSGGA